MDIHSLHDVPCDSMLLPVHNGKTFRIDWVSCGVAMVVDGVLGCSFTLSPKVLPDSPIFLPDSLYVGI